MIKRLFSICLMCMALFTGYAQGNGNGGGGFDPATPADPSTPGLTYWLTSEVKPKGGGYVNTSSARYTSSEHVWMQAYSHDGYRFEKWTCDGETVSTERSFSFEMPAKDAHLIAWFVYDPQTPGDPQTPQLSHWLTLKAEPAGACDFDRANRTRVEENQQIQVRTYSRSGYVFKGWKHDGKYISRDNPLVYTMGTADDELTAVYEYDPTTPEDPNVNSWNPETGELLIDRFTPGQIWDAVYRKVGDSYGEVKSLTVVGPAASSDLYVMKSCYGLEVADFSRTYGYSVVPEWAAEYNQSLKKVILPSCVEEISFYAFYECTNLEEIDCYAVNPPVLYENSFNGVNVSTLAVYVPAEAVQLYQKADYWKDLTILAMEEDVRSIQVNLPEDSEDGRYRNMIVQLTNDQSGQVYRNIIGDRVSYVFRNLLKETTYTAELINQQGVVLSTIPNIAVSEKAGKTVVVTFENVPLLYTVSLTVLNHEGEDVTDRVSVNWQYADTKKYFSSGREVSGVFEGTGLTYTVTLPEEMAMEYEAPAAVTFVLNDSTKVQTMQLKAFSSAVLSGVVLSTSNQTIANARITVSQRIAGLYPKTTVVTVGKDGEFSVPVRYGKTADGKDWGEASVTVTAADYISQTRKVPADQLSKYQAFALKAITGATLNLSFTYQHAALPSETAVIENEYADYGNVEYTLYNETTGTAITSFNVQYPKIVLLEPVSDGDVIKATASSRNNAFAPVESKCTVSDQSADVKLHVVARGGIRATYLTTDNADVVAVLYDNNGEFIKKVNYADKTVEFSDLQDGNYQLLSMAASDMFNDFQRLQSLNDAGLNNYTDYALDQVKVKSGVITSVVNQIVPFFDDTKVYYTGSNTSFTANKNSVTAGNYLTLKAQIDFRKKFNGKIGNLTLLVDLPSSCEFVANSLMFGDEVSTVTCTVGENNRISIPLDSYASAERTIRFCIDPTVGGDYAPNAFIQFTYNGREVIQPIGNAPFTVKDLSIDVPSRTGRVTVPVRGTAKRGAEVNVYDGDLLLAQTTALANGSWNAVIELQDPADGSEHPVYAKVVLKDGTELQTETKIVTYDPTAVVVETVHMYHNNPEMGRTYDILFDFQNPKNKPGNYIYYIYNRRFSFVITLYGTPCEDTYLVVETAKGKNVKLKIEYDPKKEYYVASGEFGNYYDGDLPVNVSIEECSLGTVPSNNDNCGFGIDPSGYVYEAVHSNRVEGVKATAYYREKVMDYDEEGREYWTGAYTDEMVWDATDYGQVNPLYTDADGMYRWDVPAAEWQVRFEKDGFISTQSEWLPVPPPQLEVNIPIESHAVPAVASVNAYEKAVEVEFDRYMKPSTLTEENVSLVKLGEETNTPVIRKINCVYGDPSKDQYTRKIRIETSEKLLTTETVRLVVSKSVESYAGINMDANYSQDFSVEKEVEEIQVAKYTNVIYNPYAEEQDVKEVVVSTSPSDAAIGKMMYAVSSDENFVTTTTEAKIDADGQATFYFTGEMNGYATVTFSIEGETVTGMTEVNVTREARQVDAPVAKASGAVYRNSNVVLTTGTKDAKIYYTVDGSEPGINSTEYTEPIVIDENKTVKAIAICDGYDDSEVLEREYTIKMTNGGMQLAEGWNWVSHNLEGEITVDDLLKGGADNINRVIGQTQELIKDPSWGLVGNLSSLSNEEAYKFQMTGTASLSLNGAQANPLEAPISLNEGWNWLGYPVDQTMSLSEALAYANPTEGDVLVEIEGGQAELKSGVWEGELKTFTPGRGYMYYAHEAMTFRYNANITSSANARFAVKTPNQTPWKCNVHKYPNVMCVTADVSDGYAPVDAGEYYFAAFCGDECRGIGSWHAGKLTITVHGNAGEQIDFRACRVDDESVEYDMCEHILFSDMLMGSFSAPFQLTFGEATSVSGVQTGNIAVDCYDLSGRRVSCRSAKGVYIYNGNKYIVH